VASATPLTARLTTDQVLELQPRRINDYVPHVPTPTQQAALALDHRFEELLYGGAAGGGKSDYLLMAALRYVEHPGYAALILRKTFADLSKPDALIPRSKEWLYPTDARYNDQRHEWTFPSGATLSFGFLQHPGDEYRYQGSAYQLVGFDEVTHIPWRQYDYLRSRLRRLAGRPVPLRIRTTGNPDGPYVDWVRDYFVEHGLTAGRPFIPSRLEDNPHLDRDAYMETLLKLDPVTRARLLDGDWDVRPPGNFFDRSWMPPVAGLPAHARAVRWWDLAATEEGATNKDPDWTVGLKLVERLGTYVIADVLRFRRTPGATERVIVQTAAADGPDCWVYMEQEPGASGKALASRYRQLLRRYPFTARTSSGSKIARAKPVSAAAEAGEIKVLNAPWNSDLFRELEAFPSNVAHDDQVDALSGAWAVIDLVPSPGGRYVREEDGHRRDAIRAGERF
jgi:predicted phage terminase large subunit-like protein